jgi:hypothetical protein
MRARPPVSLSLRSASQRIADFRRIERKDREEETTRPEAVIW